jgi:hypothetical protein
MVLTNLLCTPPWHIHSSFESKHGARQYPRYEDIKPSKKQKTNHAEDPDYHYVAFVPANGYIWELDGYNKVPIKLRKRHIAVELDLLTDTVPIT